MTHEGGDMSMLPLSLVSFRDELEAAVRRDQTARRSRRPVALRLALVAVAAGAVALGALTALPGEPGGPDVQPASAAQKAAATLAAAPGSVVHIAAEVTQRNPDGSVAKWRQESWQQTAPPYDARQIVTPENGVAVETAIVGGEREVYDPRGDVIDVSPDGSVDPALPQGTPPAAATGEPFRAQVLDLLRSGRLTPSGESTVDGRRTLSFTWDDGHTRYDYTVAAGTYEPVSWRFTPDDAATSSATMEFETYEDLPATAAPIGLEHYHPGAVVRHRG
jgi:hypothetical protein